MVQQTGHAVAESLFKAAQMVCNQVWKEHAVVLYSQTHGRLEALYKCVRQFISVTLTLLY
jgi:hypothetical protein